MNKEIREYYEMQKNNLLYPNEEYINLKENVNKADLIRFQYVYEHNKNLQGTMLDIGCNDGYFMRNFDWRFDYFVGVDMFSIDEYTRNKYKDNISQYTKGGTIKYKTGLFEEMTDLGGYNFVFAGEIIEHVKNPEEFITKIVSCLNENGSFCLTTPDSIGKNLVEHYRQYTKSELESLLKVYFTEVRVDKLPSINKSYPFLCAFCKK